MNIDELYTPEEIAQKLKVTKYTIYEMIKRGDLDAHHLGKQLRISSEQFNQYLQKGKGSSNIYEAEINSVDGDTIALVNQTKIYVNTELKGKVKISIPPEDIILSTQTLNSSAKNTLKGTVIDFFEDNTSVKVILDTGILISALITKKSFDTMGIKKDIELYIIFKTMSVKVYK